MPARYLKVSEKENSPEEEFRSSGKEIAEKIKTLMKDNNTERIILRTDKDETIIEIPITSGALGATTAPFCPVWADLNVLSTLMSNCIIVAEKKSINEKKIVSEIETVSETKIVSERRIVRRKILRW